jgi:drug/metabolite transporter (DMT)-like permease
MNNIKFDSRTKALVALALVSFFWGTTYLAITIGLGDGAGQIHGLFMSAVRQSIAGFILVAWMLLSGVKMPKAKTMLQLAVIGTLMLCMGNGLATWAMQYIPSGLGSVMSASGPVFIAVFSHFLIAKVNWSPMLIIGMALGVLGVMGISFDYLEEFLNPNFTFGIILNLAATLVWALGSVFAAKWKPNVHLMMGAGLQMIFGGAFLWLIVGIIGINNLVSGPLGWNFWGSIAYLIVFGSLISYSAFMYTLEHLPAAQASLYSYINPVVAVLLGWWILNENLNWITIVSMLTTVLGVYFVNTSFQIQYRKKKALEKLSFEIIKSEDPY